MRLACVVASKMKKHVPKISISLILVVTTWSIWNNAQTTTPYQGESYTQGTSGVLLNKTYPQEIESAVEKALAHYPDLENTDISFVYDPSVTSAVMMAQPEFSLDPSNLADRRYKIKMRPSLTIGETDPALHLMPEQILVGWLGHELGHIMDYLNRSNLEMLSFGTRYLLSDKFMKEAEMRADSFAVVHGMSCALTEMKHYIHESTELDDEYKHKISTFYPDPKDLKQFISESGTDNPQGIVDKVNAL